MKKSLLVLLVLLQATSSFGMIRTQNIKISTDWNPGNGPVFPAPLPPPSRGNNNPENEWSRKHREQQEAQLRMDQASARCLKTYAKTLNTKVDAIICDIATQSKSIDKRIEAAATAHSSQVKEIDDFHSDIKQGTYERYDPSKSPSLQRSYPEMALVPLAQRALLPLAETIVEIGQVGAAMAGFKDLNGYPRIKTPHRDRSQGWWAKQDTTPEGLAVRKMVEDGATLFKFGKRGESFTGRDSVYYGLRNPQTFEGYGPKHAMPSKCVEGANFIEMARMRPLSDFIARRIARFKDTRTGEIYEGGEWEIVVPKGKAAVDNAGHFSK